MGILPQQNAHIFDSHNPAYLLGCIKTLYFFTVFLTGSGSGWPVRCLIARLRRLRVLLLARPDGPAEQAVWQRSTQIAGPYQTIQHPFQVSGKSLLTEAGQIRTSVYSILRQEQWEPQPSRAQDMEQ